ncbi:RAxF-45 family protein [Rossellomorea aquimaris]
MNRSVGLRGKYLDFIYICRAIFHAFAFKGIRMPFFSK